MPMLLPAAAHRADTALPEALPPTPMPKDSQATGPTRDDSLNGLPLLNELVVESPMHSWAETWVWPEVHSPKNKQS